MGKSIFSKRLKYVLGMKQMTQTELSNKIGVNKSTVSRYISGKAIPGIDDLIKIAKILEVSSDYLLGLNNEFPGNTSGTINIDHAIRKCEQLADEWQEFGDKVFDAADHGDSPISSLSAVTHAFNQEYLYRHQIPKFLKDLYMNPNMSIHRR